MRRDASSPERYRASVTGAQRALLEAIREGILASAPDAEESIHHGMLSYPGVGFLGAQKHHVALYVAPEVLDAFRARLPADCGRSCVRYRRLEQLDRDVLAELIAALRAR